MKQIVLQNEKQFGRISWIPTLKMVAWETSGGCFILQTIEFYTKTRQINRILSEERRK